MRDIVIDKRMNKNGTFSYQYRFEIAVVVKLFCNIYG